MTRGGARAARGVAAALAGALLLAACATPPAAVGGDVLAGRLVVRVDGDTERAPHSVSSAFELRGDAERGALVLTSPLGTTLAQARWAPGRVELDTGEGPTRFASLEALAEQALGERLPLAALFDWLRGRPWPGAPSLPSAQGFDQLGWSVDTARHAEGWLVARRAAPPAVTLRARLEGAP